MSLKKATPKAVFEACEQLELLERSWNRDDVRLLVGGGSFSVIDPLIQAWRKMLPVREVAPSVPAELLINVAGMLESQITEYIGDIEQRDKERETALLEMNEITSNNLQQLESDLTDRLESSYQANQDLEAELSRLESELSEKEQAFQLLSIKQQVSDETVVSLNERLKEQSDFYEAALVQQKQSQLSDAERQSELHQQQLNELKLECQQQLDKQKNELIKASQLAEDRLMRMLDQTRLEQKELAIISDNKIQGAAKELQAEKQQSNTFQLEIKSLTARLSQAEQDAVTLAKTANDQVIELESEKALLIGQLKGFQTKGSEQEKTDLQQLKDSIKLLQEQMSNAGS